MCPLPDDSATPEAHRVPQVRPVIYHPTEWQQHALVLVAATGILLLSFLLQVEGQTQVLVPLLGAPLPPTCMFRNLFDLDCPGCGLTRSFVCLAHGQWLRAWHYHPIGWLLFALVAAQVPFRVTQLVRFRQRRQLLVWPGVIWIGWGLTLLLIGQWMVRGLTGKW